MGTEIERPVPQPAPWVATTLPCRKQPNRRNPVYAGTNLIPIGQVPSISTPAILKCERGAKWWA